MSKSLGNVIDPMDLVDEFGADAVRFTLTSMAAMGRDLKLSKDRIAGYRNFTTKLWNAARFAEMNGVFEPDVPNPARCRPRPRRPPTAGSWARRRARWRKSMRRWPPTGSTTRRTRSMPSSGARSATGTLNSRNRF
jgi:valyl-tRNA synthetase